MHLTPCTLDPQPYTLNPQQVESNKADLTAADKRAREMRWKLLAVVGLEVSDPPGERGREKEGEGEGEAEG